MSENVVLFDEFGIISHNLYFHNGNNQDLFNLFGILLDQNKKIRDACFLRSY